MKKNRRIILFESSLSQAACCAYEAIGRAVAERRWDLRPIEYNIIDKGVKVRPMAETPDLNEIVDLWHPDGVIVECAGREPQLPLKSLGNIPVVLLDCNPDLVDGRLSCAYVDATAIVRAATSELLSLGLSDYVYAPYLTKTDWSVRRESEFRRLVTENGCRFHRLEGPSCGGDMILLLQSLTDGIRALPKPCGIFAANDEMAHYVMMACDNAGVSVPNDVAVVGVDNDLRFCENVAVTLSSVSGDPAAVGLAAVELLEDKMTNRRKKRVVSRSCSDIKFVRRMSSLRFRNADAKTLKAIEFVRLNACFGTTPEAVAREMGCSRRFADRRFVDLLGHTVQEEIHAVRLCKVKDLLAVPGMELASIPDQCGYGSMSDLCRDFKKRTGMTLTSWRKKAIPYL